MNKNINELEHGNINRILVKFCIPSLAGSLVTSVYNIVDQLFIGNYVGVVGNGATNVVFPVITLITALSLLCGVGSSAAMNLALGGGKEDEAGKIAGNGFSLMVIYGLVLMLAMLIFTKPLLDIFGCTDTIYPYAAEYGRIVSIGFIFSMLGSSGPFLLRADGSPNYALICTVIGAVLNIVLDAMFVVVLQAGIAGAAWATVISQAVSAVLVLAYIPRFKAFDLTVYDFIPDFRLMARISGLGAGPAINFMTQTLVQIFLNNSLRIYGSASVYGSDTTLSVVGVANKVNALATAVVTGLTNGMQPIVSFNYGKKNYSRVAETAKKVILLILIIGFCIFLCYQLIPRQITSLFGEGDELYYEFAERYFRIFLMLICLNGLQSSVGGFFSAQGRPGKSILISVTRQVIFLPPLLIVLPHFFGLAGILAAGPIADGAMSVLAGTLLTKEFRRLRALQQEDE